jgi:hypothetical protein
MSGFCASSVSCAANEYAQAIAPCTRPAPAVTAGVAALQTTRLLIRASSLPWYRGVARSKRQLRNSRFTYGTLYEDSPLLIDDNTGESVRR